MTRCCMQHAGASRDKQGHALCMNVSFASVANSADTEKRHRESKREEERGEPKDPNLMRINFHFHKRDRFLLQSAGIRDPAENLCHGQTMTNRSAWARESKRRRGRRVVVGRADFPLSRRQTMPQREVPRRGTDPLSLSLLLFIRPFLIWKMRLSRLWNYYAKSSWQSSRQRDQPGWWSFKKKKKQPFVMGVRGIFLASLPFSLSPSHSPSLTVPLKPNKFTLAECATRSLGSGNYPHAIEPAACY